MSAQVLPLDDVTQFYCDIGCHGWAELIVVFRGQPTVLRVSGIFTDLPHEILKICRAIIENSSIRVALCDEPGGATVEIETDKKQQHTVILSIYEIKKSLSGFGADQEGEFVLSTRIRRQRLVGMLLAELWKTHVNLRQPSYQKGRDSFPHKELVELNKRWDQSSLGPSFLK
ncbi:hypothetical protein QTO30_05825 [Yoonia sp. GPGPB17]|uniref:hypothetical protein n=1 Tax=Yoonia sp. GPGPB17 TaxID=3026147 RepID=UPI0030C43877